MSHDYDIIGKELSSIPRHAGKTMDKIVLKIST